MRNNYFKEEKKRSFESLTENELKIITRFLVHNENQMSAFLKGHPQYLGLSNSELIRKSDLFWNLPKVKKHIRERTAKNDQSD